ncbi:hypothetical protein U9M48_007681 [Paspalum notatum var. saurae]|uniref:Uncharacterized protein n=1 Tax=Paspalum notatum var. saurae TaxID=547442 RepID=A0AAQ3WC29_PASNO
MDGRRPGEPSNGHLPSARRGIFEQVGEGFLIGGAFSSAFHFLRGIRNPTGGCGRLASAASAVRSNAPRRAGSAAAFFGLYYVFDRGVVLARRKEDRWNSAAAFAATMGVLSMRRGACTAVGCALFGGAVGLLLDGAVHVFDQKIQNSASVSQPAPPPAAVIS